MYIGTQFGCRHDTDIQVLAQLGVMHVDQTPAEPWSEWTADTLKALRDRYARHGIVLEMIHVPLSARSALRDEAGAIFLGPSDARDRQIERMCETVRRLVCFLGYNACHQTQAAPPTGDFGSGEHRPGAIGGPGGV